MKGKHIKKKEPVNLFKRNTIALVILVFLIALSVSGATYAWFTDNSNTLTNYFTAGTVIIDATETLNTDSSLAVVAPADCFEKQFVIENTGTKAIYVRALFEGYWKYMVHKNTATATATYNGQQITATDSAYYHFENPLPGLDPNHGSSQSFGFTGYDSLEVSPIVYPGSIDNGSDPDSGSSSNGCIDPGYMPITAENVPDYFISPPPDAWKAKDPDPGILPSPCANLQSFKIDKNATQVEDGKSYTNDEIEVIIHVNENGVTTFSYTSNLPVYHVYVKGGSDGGNLYRYYSDESDPYWERDFEPQADGNITWGCIEGVYGDSGLKQDDQGGWSHITFYYCNKPALEIIKEVSVDGGFTWIRTNTVPGPKLESPNQPKFKFTVTNTGSVTLSDIEITDDKLGYIGTIASLAPGASGSLEFTDTGFDWGNLTTVNAINSVTNELCNTMVDWVPEGVQTLETYFYYTEVLPAYNAANPDAHKVPLCVKFCLTDNKFAGNELILYAYFDAVQASHGMIDFNWDGYKDVWPE